MSSSWSHIKMKLQDLLEPAMDLTLDHDFVLRRGPRKNNDILWRYKPQYYWDNSIWRIHGLFDEYKNRPVAAIFEPFETDTFGLTDVLRACDRRIGHNRLIYWSFFIDDPKTRLALKYRLGL